MANLPSKFLKEEEQIFQIYLCETPWLNNFPSSFFPYAYA